MNIIQLFLLMQFKKIYEIQKEINLAKVNFIKKQELLLNAKIIKVKYKKDLSFIPAMLKVTVYFKRQADKKNKSLNIYYEFKK